MRWLERVYGFVNLLMPNPRIKADPDISSKQDAERRRSQIMARLRALEMRYEAARRSPEDDD